MIVIGIAGRAGAGKDTIADYLVETHGFAKVAFADPVYFMLQSMLGMDEETFSREFRARDRKEKPLRGIGKSPRELLQTLGTDWGRNTIDPSIWINVTGRRIEQIRRIYNPPGLVVSDVRFNNEADFIRGNGGHVWHITGRAHDPTRRANHESEAGVDFTVGDFGITNCSTNEKDRHRLYLRIESILDASLDRDQSGIGYISPRELLPEVFEEEQQ